MRKLTFALLSVLSSGCYYSIVLTSELKPCQDEAQQAVFKAWGVQHKSVPILWRGQNTLDCVSGPDGKAVMVEPGTGWGIVVTDECILGWHDLNSGQTVLIDKPTFQEAHLSHELAHAVYGDPNHELQAADDSPWIAIGDAAIGAMGCQQ